MADLSILPAHRFKYNEPGLRELHSYLKERSNEEAQQIAELLRTNPKGTVEYIFDLTPTQRTGLENADAGQLQEVTELVARALAATSSTASSEGAGWTRRSDQDQIDPTGLDEEDPEGPGWDWPTGDEPTGNGGTYNRVAEIDWTFDSTEVMPRMMNIGLQIGTAEEVEMPDYGFRFSFRFAGESRAVACGVFS